MQFLKTLLCTVANDDYAEGLCVMLYSMHKHVKGFAKFPIHIYYNPQVSPLSKENMIRVETIHQNVEFKNTPIDDSVIQNVFLKRKEYQSTYLFFQPFTESDYDQVVSFDADMLCVGDLQPLLSNPFYGIQGVAEFEPNPDYFRVNRWLRSLFQSDMLMNEKLNLSQLEALLGCRLNVENQLKNKFKKSVQAACKAINKDAPDFLFYPKSPINTGFFILGKSVLSKNYLNALINEATHFLDTHDENKVLLGDQPVINWLKHKEKLPIRLLNYNFNINFNIFSHYHDHEFSNAKIFHFTGQFKPWLEPQKKAKPVIYKLHPYMKWEKYRTEMQSKIFNKNV